MRVHATIVSWVFLLYGLAGLALGVGLLLFYGGVGTAALVEEQQIGVFAGFWGIALALGGVVIAISLPNVVAGAGLLLRRPWARPLGFGLAILNLVFAPIGTLFGAYAPVALLDDLARAATLKSRPVVGRRRFLPRELQREGAGAHRA